jgi:hypothetical protein
LLRVFFHTWVVVMPLLGVVSDASAQQAQTPRRRNAAYVELLGNGGLYSVNYERAVRVVKLRIGIASWTAGDLFGGDLDTNMFTVPLTVHVVTGGGDNHLEMGAGVLVGRQTRQSRFVGGRSTSFASLVGVLGYRHQRAEGRFVFRAGFTPFIGFGQEDDAYPDRGFLPSVGISFGAAF